MCWSCGLCVGGASIYVYTIQILCVHVHRYTCIYTCMCIYTQTCSSSFLMNQASKVDFTSLFYKINRHTFIHTHVYQLISYNIYLHVLHMYMLHIQICKKN